MMQGSILPDSRYTPAEVRGHRVLPNRTSLVVFSIQCVRYAIRLLRCTRFFYKPHSMMDTRQLVRVRGSIARYTSASIYLSVHDGMIRESALCESRSLHYTYSHTTQDLTSRNQRSRPDSHTRSYSVYSRLCDLHMGGCSGLAETLLQQVYELVLVQPPYSRSKVLRINIRLGIFQGPSCEAYNNMWNNFPTESIALCGIHNYGHCRDLTLRIGPHNPLRASRFLVLAY